MKNIPNVITGSRVIFSISLLFVVPFSFEFYLLYIFCGFSDFADGYVARKTKAESRFGAKLDSIADLVMVAVLIYIIYPILNPSFFTLIWIVAIALLRSVSILVAMIKFKTFASIHTYANKATGLILFSLPLLLPYINKEILIIVGCAVASFTAIEELIIQISSKTLDLNRKSFFSPQKKVYK